MCWYQNIGMQKMHVSRLQLTELCFIWNVLTFQVPVAYIHGTQIWSTTNPVLPGKADMFSSMFRWLSWF